MRQDTAVLIRNIRDIYIDFNLNFSAYLKMDLLRGNDVKLNSLFNADVLDKYLEYSNKLENTGQASSGEAKVNFTDQHDFMISNEQKRYGKHRVVEEIHQEIKQRKCDKKSINVVSLGIGNGETSERYATSLSVNNGDRIIGFDLHDSYMELARKKIPGLETYAFDLNSLSSDNLLPICDSSIDIIECTMVGHHVENIDIIVKEAARMLKNNGVFYYCDLIDKTQREPMMVFPEDHEYPPFHGVEFYRDHETLKNVVQRHLSVQLCRRLGPGYILLSAKK